MQVAAALALAKQPAVPKRRPTRKKSLGAKNESGKSGVNLRTSLLKAARRSSSGTIAPDVDVQDPASIAAMVADKVNDGELGYEEEHYSCCYECFAEMTTSTQFLFGSLWSLWMLTGTLFYSYQLNVGWSKGFYMAVNVGYSIGWGDISETTNPNSQWFSILFVLCGSSFVAAALGFFAQSIVDDKDNWYTNELQRIAHEKYNEDNKDNVFLLWTEWASYNVEKVRAIILWFLCITTASVCAWSMHDEWTFREAFYFSISSLSTGGLYSLPPNSPDWHYGFTGLYTAFGVPLMAVAMATLASFFINNGSIDSTVQQIKEPVTEKELDMLTDFEIANDDDVIDKSEFIILCMVRIGAATPELIKRIVEYYDELDVDGDGGLGVHEITGGPNSVKNVKKPSGEGFSLTKALSFSSSLISPTNTKAAAGSPTHMSGIEEDISKSCNNNSDDCLPLDTPVPFEALKASQSDCQRSVADITGEEEDSHHQLKVVKAPGVLNAIASAVASAAGSGAPSPATTTKDGVSKGGSRTGSARSSSSHAVTRSRSPSSSSPEYLPIGRGTSTSLGSPTGVDNLAGAATGKTVSCMASIPGAGPKANGNVVPDVSTLNQPSGTMFTKSANYAVLPVTELENGQLSLMELEDAS